MVALLNWGVCLFSASLLTKSCLLCFWNWRVSCSLVASDSLYHIIRFPSGYGEWLKGHQAVSEQVSDDQMPLLSPCCCPCRCSCQTLVAAMKDHVPPSLLAYYWCQSSSSIILGSHTKSVKRETALLPSDDPHPPPMKDPPTKEKEYQTTEYLPWKATNRVDHLE